MTLQAGTYRARGVSGALGFTKDHNPQVAVELQILDDATTGETLVWRGHFTAKTEERTLEALRILGWKTDDLSDLSGIGDNVVSIVVEEEEFEGKFSMRVRWINRVGIGLKAPMSPQEAKAFAAQMRGKAVASRAALAPAQTQNTSKPRQPAQAPASIDDDKIPF